MPNLKFAYAALLEKRGDPRGQDHVAGNGERHVYHIVEPIGVVGRFLEAKYPLNHERAMQTAVFSPLTKMSRSPKPMVL